MRLILWAQLIVPVCLVAWMLLWPPVSTAGVLVQLTASLLLLWLIVPIGIWLFPPWWTPFAAAVLLLVAAERALRSSRRGRDSADASHHHRPPPQALRAQHGLRSKMAGAAWSIAALVFAVFGIVARGGGEPPTGRRVADLAFPLYGDQFLVVNGGSVPSRNSHLQSLDTSITRLQPWRGNAYAVDLVAIDRWGIRARGVQPRDPTGYRIFGSPVLAPCAGTVVHHVDGLRDMPVPEYDRQNIAGNHLLIRCGMVDVLLAHLQQGSLLVATGDSVRTGSILARVGNSGGTDEPHLHVHAQRAGPDSAPYSGDPVPVRYNGQFLARGDRVRRLNAGAFP